MKSTIGYYAAFIVLGLVTAIVGPTLPGLAERTHSTLSQASVLFPANWVGYLAGVLFSGWVFDRFAGHRVLAFALLGMAGGLALLSGATWLGLAALAMALLGAVGAIVDVGANTLIVWVHGRAVGPFMNGLHFFFGVGAAAMPVLFSFVTQRSGSFALGFWVLALPALPAALWVLLQRSPAHPQAAQGGASAPLNLGLILLVAACLFLYVGMEIGYGGWVFTYAQAKGQADPAAAALLTSAFWGALTAGRLLSVPLALRFSSRTLLLADFAVILLGVGTILLFTGSLTALWIGTLAVGLGMASVFPTTLSMAEQRMAITGRVTSLIFVGSSAGGMVLPWLMGQVIEPLGPDAVIVVILVDSLLALAAYLYLIFGTGRPSERPAGRPVGAAE